MILGWEGADPRNSDTFNEGVAQAILFFGSETWAIKPRIGRTLRGLHHRVNLHMAAMQPT